jgi:hypothetical protein
MGEPSVITASPLATASLPGGSLLVTERILQEAAPQPPEVMALTVTGISLWLVGQRTLGLAVRVVISSSGHAL